MTNGEMIKSLSSDGLARFLTKLTECCSLEECEDCNECPAVKSCCYGSMLNWLNSEDDIPTV